MGEDVILRLDAVEELFTPARGSLDAPVPGAKPGVERVLDELLVQRRIGDVRLVLVLPSDALRPGLEADVTDAIGRWCAQRRRDNDNSSGALLRLGINALLPGLVLLAIGLLVAEGVRRSSLPFDVRVLGDGLAIVIAWVAIWYPLDTLFYARAPYRRANAALHAMHRMHLVINAGDGAPN